jgi:aspartate/methionine/tyrosine aminotransferase
MSTASAIVVLARARFHSMTAPTAEYRAHFPYMFWAHTEAFASPYCLSVSGMPAPDPAVLGISGPPDLGPAPVEALPALEARLGELFGVAPERVLVCMGASGAMHLAAMRFLRGAHVVTESPSYEAFRALAGLYGRSARVVRRRHEDGFRLPLDAVEAALGEGGPAHLFLCSPHNPTGVVSSPEDLVRLAGLAERAGGILISSEVYMEFAPPAQRFHAFALAPNALSIGSLTKAYGLGALRIGWIVLGEGLAGEREALLDHSYLVGVDPPTPTLRAARAALDRLGELLRPVRAFEVESRPHLARWLEESPLVEGTLGPHGLNAFPRVLGVDDTRALARHAADTQGVAVVPGEFFGAPGHLRVGYGVPEATLVEALARLDRAIRTFPERSG